MASERMIKLVRRGRGAIARWRRANPDALLNLTDADLSEADLRGANLKRSDMTGADLRGANLTGAQLAEADLTRADLRTATLIKADLYQTRLYKATLEESRCGGAHFRRSDLTQADLSRADLTRADLVDVQIHNGSLAGATLVGADLSRSILDGVDLRDAVLGWTTLGNLDLNRVVGLDQIVHVGPSTLGLDTVIRSCDRLTKEFLRGCGVAESILQSWSQLFDHPFEQFACLIRFAPEDHSFAKHLWTRSQEKGLRCWLDEMPTDRSERKHRSAPTSYESVEQVILCLSKASLTSWWFDEEVERLLERERAAKEAGQREERLLFPLNLDGYLFSGDFKHPHEKTLGRLVIDFVGWRRNQEKFDQELTRLLGVMTEHHRRKN